MSSAGFVLAGGASSRMGRDKALLASGGRTLLEIAANRVGAAAGSATVIGPRERYAGLGLEIVPDLRSGAGPLGGIETALALQRADWNLIVACDMPGLSRALLDGLLARAVAEGPGCVLAMSPSGLPEPLCGVWRGTMLGAVSRALDAGVRKVTQALDGVQVSYFQVDSAEPLANLNAPEDWTRWAGAGHDHTKSPHDDVK